MPVLQPSLQNLTESLDELRLTCTICAAVSLAASLPIVLTGLIVKERRKFPSRLTTLFFVKIMLMNVVVLLGSIVNYRIPNKLNLYLNATSPVPLTLMSPGFCKVQAVSYQFLIWCVMSYWVAIAFCLCKVVTSASEVLDLSPLERRCYIIIYGVAAFFTAAPLVIDQTVAGSQVYRADDSALWCWLTAENITHQTTAPLLPGIERFVPWSQVAFFYTFELLYFFVGITYSVKILQRLCGESAVVRTLLRLLPSKPAWVDVCFAVVVMLASHFGSIDCCCES